MTTYRAFASGRWQRTSLIRIALRTGTRRCGPGIVVSVVLVAVARCVTIAGSAGSSITVLLGIAGMAILRGAVNQLQASVDAAHARMARLGTRFFGAAGAMIWGRPLEGHDSTVSCLMWSSGAALGARARALAHSSYLNSFLVGAASWRRQDAPAFGSRLLAVGVLASSLAVAVWLAVGGADTTDAGLLVMAAQQGLAWLICGYLVWSIASVSGIDQRTRPSRASSVNGVAGGRTSLAVPVTRPSWWQRWPDWAGYAAAVWSLLYGALILGLYLALGVPGFPFGEGDPQSVLSILHGARAEVGAPVIAALGLVGAIVGLAMARLEGRGLVHTALLVFAWVAAATLALLIPDYRMLMAVAYAPLFVVGAPFGWPPGSFFDVITWPVVNQLICIGGGLLWAGAAVAYGRRARGACGSCGRGGIPTGRSTPEAAARWGRWAVGVAVVVPLLYAATRWAWALGIPLGISEDFLREGQEVGLWLAGAGLATVAAVGALLTLGLVQRWGEVFPQWIPYIGGRLVPPALAIVPASLVAVLVTTAGLMFVRLTLRGSLGEVFAFIEGVGWAALAPELLWPVWGVALGAAALAYYLRRRGTCARCGRS